jgi:hypothetical protein
MIVRAFSGYVIEKEATQRKDVDRLSALMVFFSSGERVLSSSCRYSGAE